MWCGWRQIQKRSPEHFLYQMLKGRGLDTVGQRGEHLLCGIELDGVENVGAPHDVSVDPHRPPDFPFICQPPQEV